MLMRLCSLALLVSMLGAHGAEPSLSVSLKGGRAALEASAATNYFSVLDCTDDFVTWKECALFAPTAEPVQRIEFALGERARFYRLRAFSLPLEMKSGQPISTVLAAGSNAVASWGIDGGNLPEGIAVTGGKLVGTPSTLAGELSASGNYTNILEAVFPARNPDGSSGDYRMSAQIMQHVRLSFSRNLYPERPNGPSLGAICIKCHGSGFPPDFSPSATTLLNVHAGSAGEGECPDTWKYLVAGSLAESLVYQKIVGQVCGARMPQGGPYLNSTQIDRLARWIAELRPGETD